MRNVLLTALMTVCITLSAAADNETKAQLEKRRQDFSQALTQGKADTLSSFFTDDAELYNPKTGEQLEGKDKINQFLLERAKEINSRHLTFSFEPIKTDIQADSANVQGILELNDGDKLVQRSARSVDFVKQNGQWFIDSVQDIEVPPPFPGYDRLRQLEWLIGNWVDKDEDLTITYNANWDSFKNFIIQKFKMEVLSLEELSGIQIIGWDPTINQFRSWVYDSDGGFGTGVWTKTNNGWKVAMTYVLSDGKKGSGTNSYTDITDKGYTFSSTDREVNGEKLPDIEPATIVKE